MMSGIAGVLEVLGDRWALLVVREVSLGRRRFDEIHDASGAPRTVLADRLRRLVSAGVLGTREYQRPGSRAHREYTLTDAGLDLIPVLAALSDWGERHLASDEPPAVVYRHVGCGGRISATLRCECGEHPDVRGRLVAQINR